jgi:hypothetical protein
MHRRKNMAQGRDPKQPLASRLREVRIDFCGERGGPEFARRLGVPSESWHDYETGIAVPAKVVLSVIQHTLVHPVWLFQGEGEKYRTPAPGRATDHPDRWPARPETGLVRRLSEFLERGGLEIMVKWGKSTQRSSGNVDSQTRS